MNTLKTSLFIMGLIALAAIAYALMAQPAPNVDTRAETPRAQENMDAAPSAKINIDAVCEGALAYMTFPDGAAADVFVGECKEGKHPEVIEKYKASLNLDGATI